MDERKAREIMDDVAMRAALWKLLAAQQPDNLRSKISPDAPPDHFVREDLKRILFPRRKIFGLF